MQRPRIGLTSEFTQNEKDTYACLRFPYVRAVRRAGGLPVILPPLPPGEAAEAVEHLDGLLLTGGDDLSPAVSGGGGRRAGETPLHPRRERWDLALAAAAVRAERPLLALCLGLQELSTVLGGTLIRSIPEEVPGALPHKRGPGTRGDPLHPVRVEKGSRLHRLLGPELRVNSSHIQAVRRPGRGLRVTARAPDGVIEALEGEGDAFLLGVQWHPERMEGSPEQERLFRALVEAAAGAS